MSAVWIRARADLRRRWLVTVLLVVLVGLAGGVVLAAVAGARRTDSAVDRFLAYSRPMDVEVYGLDYAAVSRLPQVADADEAAFVVLAPSTPDGQPDLPRLGSIAPFVTIHGRLGVTSDRGLLVGGRLPDPDQPLEAYVNETLARARHLAPGDTLHLWAYSARQVEQGVDSSVTPRPDGPPLDVTVTGILRKPNDLNPVPVQKDVVYLGSNELYLTPAFWRAYGDSVASIGSAVAVRLRHEEADLNAFEAAARALPGGRDAQIVGGSDASRAVSTASRATHVQAVALLGFALLTALGAVLIVGQAIARQVQVDADQQAVLRALGMTRLQLAAAPLVRAGVVGICGAVLAVVVAVLASPLTPFGLARQAEIDPGLAVDVPVLAVGALVLLLVVIARAGVAARWTTRPSRGFAPQEQRRSSGLAARAAQAGAPPSAVTGLRMAFESWPPRAAASARLAMVGGVAAVAAVAASLTFAASLEGLVRSPHLQGWNWDVVVGNAHDVADIMPKSGLLAGNPHVGGYSLLGQSDEAVQIDGVRTPVVGLTPVKGDVGLRVLGGREPRSGDEIALGQATLRRLGRSVGDTVEVTGAEGRRRSFRIVGQVLLPASIVSEMTMSSGAVVTVDAMGFLQPDAPPGQFIVRYAPGVDPAAGYASLRRDFGPTVLRALPPDEVENVHRVSGLPVLLAGVLAVLGAATIGHALVTSVRGRRRDLAVLKSLGFVRRQVFIAVVWQATVFAAVALLFGLPLGVAAGRGAWVLVNRGLGSAAGPVIPALAVLVLIPATILLANVLAALPARTAAATRPARVLRAE
jgi:ABC-type lipoprotein release transport system permease subunit